MASKNTFSNNEGFTLVEVLVSASIVVVIAGMALYSFSAYRQRAAFDNADTDLVSLIQEARSKTLDGATQLQYGVHVASNGATLFSGTSYSGGSNAITSVSFDPSVTLSNINLAGGTQDIVFTRSTGETNGYGTLMLTNTSGKQATITVQETGLVSD